uniref:Small ribosomal subunit protein uS19c n=1 Tax=Epipogium roseum TaxID=556037 RepID=A0A0B4N4U0_9ASPA|nr:ribosomal protein S19 [Epipogium roseum]AII40864.1 ribosomal protein S19 [Epipogium roseum]
MARSKKKPPFVANHLFFKINNPSGIRHKEVIITWSRASTIIPAMIGHTIAIYNGKYHLPIYIQDRMVGHKIGEFVPTINLVRHSINDNKIHH